MIRHTDDATYENLLLHFVRLSHPRTITAEGYAKLERLVQESDDVPSLLEEGVERMAMQRNCVTTYSLNGTATKNYCQTEFFAIMLDWLLKMEFSEDVILELLDTIEFFYKKKSKNIASVQCRSTDAVERTLQFIPAVSYNSIRKELACRTAGLQDLKCIDVGLSEAENNLVGLVHNAIAYGSLHSVQKNTAKSFAPLYEDARRLINTLADRSGGKRYFDRKALLDDIFFKEDTYCRLASDKKGCFEQSILVCHGMKEDSMWSRNDNNISSSATHPYGRAETLFDIFSQLPTHWDVRTDLAPTPLKYWELLTSLRESG